MTSGNTAVYRINVTAYYRRSFRSLLPLWQTAC